MSTQHEHQLHHHHHNPTALHLTLLRMLRVTVGQLSMHHRLRRRSNRVVGHPPTNVAAPAFNDTAASGSVEQQRITNYREARFSYRVSGTDAKDDP